MCLISFKIRKEFLLCFKRIYFMGGYLMKKVISLFLILTLFATTAVFAGCAGKKTSVNVKIVIDQGADGEYEEIIYDSAYEIAGVDPSIETILTKLDEAGTIKVEYTEEEDGSISLYSINDNKVETEATKPVIIHQWNASINGTDVNGSWSKAIVKEGDTVLIRYDVWESSIK